MAKKRRQRRRKVREPCSPAEMQHRCRKWNWPMADFEDGQIGILNLLVKAGLAPSNGEARRNVQQGGVSIDGNKVEDVRAQISKDSIGEDGIVLKRGKKKFMKIVVR